jgi:hypothetical protein
MHRHVNWSPIGSFLDGRVSIAGVLYTKRNMSKIVGLVCGYIGNLNGRADGEYQSTLVVCGLRIGDNRNP